MNGVDFETDRAHILQKMAMVNTPHQSSSKFVQWLMNMGIVSSDAAAQRLLLGIVFLNIIITLVVVFFFL